MLNDSDIGSCPFCSWHIYTHLKKCSLSKIALSSYGLSMYVYLSFFLNRVHKHITWDKVRLKASCWGSQEEAWEGRWEEAPTAHAGWSPACAGGSWDEHEQVQVGSSGEAAMHVLRDSCLAPGHAIPWLLELLCCQSSSGKSYPRKPEACSLKYSLMILLNLESGFQICLSLCFLS